MMENVQHTWKQTTAELYKAVLIFTLAGVAVSVSHSFSPLPRRWTSWRHSIRATG